MKSLIFRGNFLIACRGPATTAGIPTQKENWKRVMVEVSESRWEKDLVAASMESSITIMQRKKIAARLKVSKVEEGGVEPEATSLLSVRVFSCILLYLHAPSVTLLISLALADVKEKKK